MKKFLAATILSASSLGFAASAEAKSNTAVNAATAAKSQVTYRSQNRFQQRRVVTSTRNVRRGRFLYRETYRTVYRPNGRVATQLVSRVQIRRF